MSSFSDYLEDTLGNVILRGQSYTGGTVYAALFTSDPTDANTGNELTDSGYARQQVHNTSVSDGFTAPSNGATSNANVVTFPAIVDNQVIVTHWALFDASTGGNMLYHAPLTNPKTLDPSDVLSFPIGSLNVTHK